MTDAMIEELRNRYAKIATVDPCGDTYPRMAAFLDKLPQDILRQLAGADIKWISSLARNRMKPS